VEQGPGANAARGLSGALSRLANADPLVREQAETTIVEPLRRSLDQLRQALKPQRISVEAIPGELAREWITPDGRARVQVLPKGDPDDTAVLRAFVTAVLEIEPNATGEAVALYESGNTVVRAFIAAGIFALSGISGEQGDLEADIHHNAQSAVAYKLYRCSRETEPTSSVGFITCRWQAGMSQDDSIFANFDAVAGVLIDQRARRGRPRSRPPGHSATAAGLSIRCAQTLSRH
jgi:hypothetical protein